MRFCVVDTPQKGDDPVLLCSDRLDRAGRGRFYNSGQGGRTANEPRQIPIYYVDTAEKVCAISFDAAWGNEQTNTLLDILDAYEVKSTFFLVKQWVDNFPTTSKAIAEHGHDVGNHSATHPHMAQLTSDQQIKIERL